jgi:hypothetical protein
LLQANVISGLIRPRMHRFSAVAQGDIQVRDCSITVDLTKNSGHLEGPGEMGPIELWACSDFCPFASGCLKSGEQ